MSDARLTVLVADDIARDGLAPLLDDPRFDVVVQPGLKGDALADAIATADAVLVRSATKITADSLKRAERLRVIGRAGVGVDTIDLDAATARGIAVLTAPSGNTIAAAELTLALLLALVRRVPAADRSMKAGEWDRKGFSGTELHGKVLGLVGAGRIGSTVAQRARAFDMRVMAYDPFLSADQAQRLGVQLAELDELLREADVISLHLPLTDATRGLIGAARLAIMKPTAVLLNVARGGIADETALVEALKAGRLAGAALDVFEKEPLPADHPLRSLENVVLTPHLGASTAEAQHEVALEIARAVRAALLEGDLSKAVNAPALGGEELRRVRPMLSLAERLGRLGSVLLDAPLARVSVRQAGGTESTLSAVTASAMVGVLSSIVDRSGVNPVNALHLARQRGVEVHRVIEDAHVDHAELLELVLRDDRGRQVRVAGALIAEGHPRILRIDEYRVDVRPKGTLVVLRNRDVPGVIGRVGTLLGTAAINIGEYHQARLSEGGDALAAIGVDGPLPAHVLTALRALPDVTDVRQVGLD
jgi:D-3-phosphoglycerate dehydrogenase